jgi:hypothetical protein
MAGGLLLYLLPEVPDERFHSPLRLLVRHPFAPQRAEE